jgi:hypothetical protein
MKLEMLFSQDDGIFAPTEPVEGQRQLVHGNVRETMLRTENPAFDLEVRRQQLAGFMGQSWPRATVKEVGGHGQGQPPRRWVAMIAPRRWVAMIAPSASLQAARRRSELAREPSYAVVVRSVGEDQTVYSNRIQTAACHES